MNPKVSVIIPIYNAKTVLRKTIQSVINQSYHNLEIILVNDCSSDSSLAICQQFARKDNRIIVVDKLKNEGVDYARFSGLEVATGDFITFLDADDRFLPNAVTTWLDIQQKHKVDIVYANNIRVFSTRLGIKKCPNLPEIITDHVISGAEKDELSISFFGVNLVPVTAWGNLYNRTLFKEELKKSGAKFGEDLLMTMQLYLRAKSLFVTNTPVLNYRWGGITSKYQPKFIECCRLLFNRKMEALPLFNNPRARRTTIIELVNCLGSQVSQLAEYFPKNREANIESLRKEMSDPIYKYFDEVIDNPYFKDGALNTACAHRDYMAAYNIAERKMRRPKTRLRCLAKKVATILLKVIPI